MKLISSLLLVLGFFLVQFSIAQQPATRPKIGLTLSGGGAKGLAHIGILKAIDKAGLKVEYITGTSMGSIIGGLYAAGYSGDSIEQVVRKLDWEVLFSTAPPLKAISIEEKSEYGKYPLAVPFEKRKIKIGRGIIDGQELWLKLSEMFEPVYNINDFSKLSIPFKCIGTDIETGNAVTMDHGNIVTAIRASMAIPSVFPPVKYDNKLLVDGGVVNNFPVLDVKQMGADYVIGVNLGHRLAKAEDLESPLDILLQIGFFKDASTFEKHKSKCDLYILPELKGYGTGSFGNADSIIDIGIETGNTYYPYFKKMSDSLNTIYGKTDFEKDRLPKVKQIKISKYTAEGFKHTNQNFFFGLLDLHANKVYSYREINQAIHRVYGSTYYKIIRYNFLPDPDGNTEMHFSVEENLFTAIKVGLNFNSFTQLGLNLNFTARDLLLKESRALVSVSLSENMQLYAEYFKYINKKRNARLVLDYSYQNTPFPVYNDFRLYQTMRSTYKVFDFQLQQNINRFSYFGVGQQIIFSKIKTQETASSRYTGNNNYSYSYLTYVLNSTNQKYFPTRGWNIKAKAGYVFGQTIKNAYDYSNGNKDSAAVSENNYLKILINSTHFSELNSKFSLSQNLSFAYIAQEHPFMADNFFVGGVNNNLFNQISFVGLNVSEIRTASIASLCFGLQYKLAKKAYLTGRINGALYNFQGSELQYLTTKNNMLTGYGLTFGYDSPIGPLEFTLMFCDQDGKLHNFINIGFAF